MFVPEFTFLQPLRELLDCISKVFWRELCAWHSNVPLVANALCNNVEQIANAILVLRRSVVLGDGATSDDSAKIIHDLNRCFQDLTSNVVYK